MISATSSVLCLTVFTLEIYGFRHRSAEHWSKLYPYCLQWECSPNNLVFGNIWLMVILPEITEKKRVEERHYRRCPHSTARNRIVQYCAAMSAIAEFLYILTHNWFPKTSYWWSYMYMIAVFQKKTGPSTISLFSLWPGELHKYQQKYIGVTHHEYGINWLINYSLPMSL